MDGRTWLGQRRADVVAAYDAEAPDYEEYPNDAQRDWVGRLLAECPDGGVVVDAPCGTRRYLPHIADAGIAVVRIDQSAGMLEQARLRNIAVALHHVGLQEMSLAAEFDAAVTIDAMENVPPEDWPPVLANLHRAVRAGGLLYMTVEETDSSDLDEHFTRLTGDGHPAIRGEIIEGDVAGYHYYPPIGQVLTWFDEAGWQPIAEGFTQEDGWGYRHFMLRRLGSG